MQPGQEPAGKRDIFLIYLTMDRHEITLFINRLHDYAEKMYAEDEQREGSRQQEGGSYQHNDLKRIERMPHELIWPNADQGCPFFPVDPDSP